MNVFTNFFKSVKLSLPLFFSLLILVIIFSLFIYQFQLHQEKQHIKDLTRVKVMAFKKSLNRELDSILNDLELLSSYEIIGHYLKDQTSQNYQDISEYWLEFAKNRKSYDQIRLLQENGLEQIRVEEKNKQYLIVDSENLKDKSSRYYYKKAILLDADEYYISPFDLNKENGLIEIPFKPVIRFAKQVVNEQGKLKGILVLNYKGKKLLNLLSQFEKDIQGRLLLINNQGYYLRGLEPDTEWGFMFPNQTDNFSRDFNDVWQVMGNSISGQNISESGIFTYDTINFPVNSRDKIIPYIKTWHLVNYLSLAEYSKKTSSIFQVMYKQIIIMLIIIFIVSVLWGHLKMLRLKDHQALIESEERSRLILESTVEGIYGVDHHGQITFVNPAVCKLLGYSEKNLIGKNSQELFYLKNDNNNSCRVHDDMKHGEVHHSSDAIFYTKSGRSFVAEYTISPMHKNGKIEGSVVVFRDITERKEIERTLEKMATTDRLTGIYNRLKFDELIQNELAKSRRYLDELSLAIFDIDHFKNINDQYGHAIGDSVLKEVSEIVTHVLRETDVFARWGGEEFVILSSNTSLQGMCQLAEKVRKTIALHQFKIIKSITVSIGVGQFEHEESEQYFFARVDKALYQAKQYGRNCVINAVQIQSDSVLE